MTGAGPAAGVAGVAGGPAGTAVAVVAGCATTGVLGGIGGATFGRTIASEDWSTVASRGGAITALATVGGLETAAEVASDTGAAATDGGGTVGAAMMAGAATTGGGEGCAVAAGCTADVVASLGAGAGTGTATVGAGVGGASVGAAGAVALAAIESVRPLAPLDLPLIAAASRTSFAGGSAGTSGAAER